MTMARWPLRIRLAAVNGAVFLVVIAVLEIAAYSTVRAAIHSVVDRELETRLAGIEDHLVRHLDKYGWAQMGVALDAHPAFQPAYLVIRSATGQTIFEGQGMAAAPEPRARLATIPVSGKRIRVLSVRCRILGQVYVLRLGTDLQMASGALDRFRLILLVSLPLLLMVCTAVACWMSGRALAPIQQIARAARSIDPCELSRRVPVPATGDEVQQLAETFNAMLERIEDGFRKMREFAANASHELRTPIAIVRAAAEVALLRKRPTEAAYREALERILRESVRNSSLLESMLVLSRMDWRADQFVRETVRLNESVAEACEDMSALALARDVRLRPVLAPANPMILADRGQLRRLCLILIDNGIKYTPEGGAVTVRVDLLESGVPAIEVTDTGIGIARDQQHLVFERFYRVDKARSRGLGGAGLGLSIAREIALLHQAAIDLDSEPGRGSRFRVSFPLQATVPAVAAPDAVRSAQAVLR